MAEQAIVSRIKVQSSNATYSENLITAEYRYETTNVHKNENGSFIATPNNTKMTIQTRCDIPKVGVMLVGIGGNNGTTLIGTIIANSLKLLWETKRGKQNANYIGSITQCSTVYLGIDENGNEVYVPLSSLVPMCPPENIVFDGWDINNMDLANAMKRAQVFEPDLQRQLWSHMEKLKPRPSAFEQDFVAANQEKRCNNLIKGTKKEQLEQIRADIREFKETNSLDTVIVLWTANTERFCDIIDGINTSSKELLDAIERNESEISPSTLFGVASVLEGCTYINTSPQNTFVPGLIDLARENDVFIVGDDLKTGQTKIKSVLVDFLVSAGMKPRSIVSYNHLGNNDGLNLSAEKQFRSKEITKSSVIDDSVIHNTILYPTGKKPDHCIVIKYIPEVGDSKRAMDEYVSEISMGGRNTIVLHNTCEDSLLAAPVILDLIILAELFQRVQFKLEHADKFEKFSPILSILSYLCKAPLVDESSPVINALFSQKSCIENVMRACIGLQPINHMGLEYKIKSLFHPVVKTKKQINCNSHNDC